MPFEDFVVADADMHVMEPADLWQRYIAKEYKHAAPVGMTELRRDIRLKVKSQIRCPGRSSHDQPAPPTIRYTRPRVLFTSDSIDRPSFFFSAPLIAPRTERANPSRRGVVAPDPLRSGRPRPRN